MCIIINFLYFYYILRKKDLDINENVLDESVLQLLFDGNKSAVISVDEIIKELKTPDHTMLSTEEMDKYILDFLEENKGEQSPSSLEKNPK